jgi:hypothetical protein
VGLTSDALVAEPENTRFIPSLPKAAPIRSGVARAVEANTDTSVVRQVREVEIPARPATLPAS